MKKMLTILVLAMGGLLTAYAGGTYMNVSTERRYVIGYTKGTYVVRNGKTIYIPGNPIFATRTTGFTVSIGTISVTDHGIHFKIAVKKVDAKDFVADADGNALALAKARDYTINGTRSTLLGKHDGRAYFRQSKSRKVVSLALLETPPSEAKSEKE